MTLALPFYQIDAFTDKVFGGNPAAVVPLAEWLTNTQMQSIAAENNLAETAFFVPKDGEYQLRWFTPTQEVPLCGHATLASAFVLFTEVDPSQTAAVFQTLSGPLSVTRGEGGLLTLALPRHELVPAKAPPELRAGLNLPPSAVYRTLLNPNYCAVYETEAEVRALAPDSAVLARLDLQGVVVTAPGGPDGDADFVSRYFAPGIGIPEDPVTGSAHCALTPYWAGRLGKTTLHARQVSKRGGELFCTDAGDRALISGHAVKYSEGRLFL